MTLRCRHEPVFEGLSSEVDPGARDANGVAPKSGSPAPES